MEVRDDYVADMSRYSGPLREGAREADKFSDKNDKAAIAARKMGMAAKEAADKAARAQKDAADAAEKLARGELKADEAAQAEAKALREVERAAIKAAEAELAAGKAADKAAANFKQVARDAELAAAAQRLGALQAAGATKDYNSLLSRLKTQHGDLSKTAVSGFKVMKNEGNAAYQALTSASSSLGEMNKLWLVGIANGLVVLPELASAAAGALTLGLGGAIAGVGILFAAKNAEIRAQYSNLGHEIFGGLTKASEPFVGALRRIGMVGESEFRTWQPLVQGAFASMAPAVEKFATATVHSLDQFKPAFSSIVNGFNIQLGALGDHMGSISHNIATGVQAIGDAAARNPGALASLVTDLSLMVRYGGDTIGFLVRFKTEFDGFMNVLAGGGPMGLLHLVDGFVKLKNVLGGGGSLFGQLSSSLDSTSGSADGAASAMTGTSNATDDLLSAQKVATMTSDQLKAALDKLTGANQSAFDAQTAYANALNAASALAKKSNAGFDGTSKAIQANRRALSDLGQAFKADLTGKTPQEIAKMRESFIKVAEGMGASKQRAKELADQLLGVSGNMKKIPEKKDTKIGATDNTKPATASAKKGLSGVVDKVYRAHLTAVNMAGAAASAAGSVAKRFAGGLYRANLTAINRAGAAVSAAAGAARRFASGTYRASLTAANNAWSALRDAFAAGNQWAGKVFTATFNVIKKIFSTGGYVAGYADGGQVQGFPAGGQVRGPGTSTSDSIPAMLSDGEYVINAAQTKKWRGLLDSINYGVNGFAEGGLIEEYASGGKVKAKPKPKPKPKPLTKAQKAGQARVAHARARPEYLAAMAAQHALESMRRNIYGGFFQGGKSTPGSAHGTVVQHVTTINVNVAGSIRSDQEIAKVIAKQLITNRMPVALPKGR